MLFTIGHSNHTPEHFLHLLEAHSIDVIGDVRSWPRSQFASWADRETLPALLATVGRRYVFLGDALGGRPDDPSCYDDDGHVLYGRVAGSDDFKLGIARLRDGLSRYRVAVMCSEEDPTSCHRRLLISKVLIEDGVAVAHVRGDGRLLNETGVLPPAELGLFDDGDSWWRSSQSVSHRRRHATSLRR